MRGEAAAKWHRNRAIRLPMQSTERKENISKEKYRHNNSFPPLISISISQCTRNENENYLDSDSVAPFSLLTRDFSLATESRGEFPSIVRRAIVVHSIAFVPSSDRAREKSRAPERRQ